MEYANKTLMTPMEKKALASTGAMALSPDAYILAHEGGHYGFSHFLGGNPDFNSSNFGNTPLAEGLEDAGILPNNGGEWHPLSHEPAGYINAHDTGNLAFNSLVDVGGHLSTLGLAGGLAYLGNKNDSMPAKVAATSVSGMQAGHAVYDMVTKNPASDIFTFSTMAGINPLVTGSVIAAGALATAAYAWWPKIKNIFKKKEELLEFEPVEYATQTRPIIGTVL